MQLQKEVDLLKRLSHPSVVTYEGLVRTEHYVNIILESVTELSAFCSGGKADPYCASLQIRREWVSAAHPQCIRHTA